MIYFILADASGAMTTSDGKVILTIYERSYWVKLYSRSFNVKKTDFQKTKVGMSAFEREVILCSIGRITYSSFTRWPYKMTGKVDLEFQRPDGQILTGSETVSF
ncbi:MAG: hypothetical protein QME52_07165 [Bacteroidota bacterium]|nr:hypothetical protein [Bacteroidota bacterium]